MSLMLHAGAEPVELSALQTVPVPEATDSHVPIPHIDFLDFVKMALQVKNHVVTTEEYGVTPDGMRFFGVLQLESKYGDYTDVVGLRNSNDKAFPVGVSYGSRVFVCDNLAFVGDNVVKRRHTAKLLRDLPGLVIEMIAPLADERERQFKSIQAYKSLKINRKLADFIIMESFRQQIINVQRIAEVEREWEAPSYEDFQDRNAWSLFNAFTHVLAGKVAGNPSSTQKLHNVIDGVCDSIN
tara:strand:+ start:6330 stop:7049 length:720 start_codon:yes stop_codon:yes gene_type:complete